MPELLCWLIFVVLLRVWPLSFVLIFAMRGLLLSRTNLFDMTRIPYSIGYILRLS